MPQYLYEQHVWNMDENTITSKYTTHCNTISDIDEHLPTLRRYASVCPHITECGVRSVVSSYAFAQGLLDMPELPADHKIVQVDLCFDEKIPMFAEECKSYGINTVFYEQSDLTCPIEATDLLFIDTWHIYGQLKRELARWHPFVRKYIILHDTTVDEFQGESIRCGLDIKKQSVDSGYPEEEITKGLWPAVEEFLVENHEWIIKERYNNNNGLTVLERVRKVCARKVL